MNPLKEKVRPNYKGDGIAIWKNIDKNGIEYLTIKMVGHNTISEWTYDPDYNTENKK